ncbi:MAG TPA: substrate-binding domain-containing protein [Gemmatimonadales bacterium]|nr:substrate-binding domain-containing protein [Gemmatimonadales bacterium]
MCSRSDAGWWLGAAVVVLVAACTPATPRAPDAQRHVEARADGDGGPPAPGMGETPWITTPIRPATASDSTLRVCADPNNLPFSNAQREGFENRLAQLIADDFGVPVRYTWWPERRGFIRNTLKAGLCDVVLGVPEHLEMVSPTSPYYRSTYVFVTRTDRHLGVRSLDDTILGHLRIGVQVAGDDYSNPPAAEALAVRGLADHVVGYTLYGDYSRPNPPSALVSAVARGDVDLAIVWGPLAGYFARRERVPLTLTPVQPAMDGPARPFVFAIAAATRRSDSALHRRLEEALTRHHEDVDALLKRYGVPLLPDSAVVALAGSD